MTSIITNELDSPFWHLDLTNMLTFFFKVKQCISAIYFSKYVLAGMAIFGKNEKIKIKADNSFNNNLQPVYGEEKK